jgi:hypothetical protein
MVIAVTVSGYRCLLMLETDGRMRSGQEDALARTKSKTRTSGT